MNIEFIKAYEDRTWNTEVINVPDWVTEERVSYVNKDDETCTETQQVDQTSSDWDSAIVAWCHDELAQRTQYRKVVYWGIYNSEPGADAEVPELTINQDVDAEDSRSWQDNLGRMVCWHGHYDMGDEQPGGDPLEWQSKNVPAQSVVLCLYLLDHFGITMSTESFNDQWDSGQVGIIFVTPDQVKETYGDFSAASCEKARDVLRDEVKLYDHYLRGAVWIYEFGDELFGNFTGDTLEETGIADSIPEEAKDQLETAWGNRHAR